MAPGDFLAQTRYVASLIEQSLRSRQLGNAHVAKLVVYYVPDATSDQALAELVERFGVGFLIVPIAVRISTMTVCLSKSMSFAVTHRGPRR